MTEWNVSDTRRLADLELLLMNRTLEMSHDQRLELYRELVNLETRHAEFQARENERLNAERERLCREADGIFQEISNIPGVIPNGSIAEDVVIEDENGSESGGNRTLEMSHDQRLELYRELVDLETRLAEFQAHNGSIAEDVVIEDENGSESGGSSNGSATTSDDASSSSTSTTSSDRRENERLIAEGERLRREADVFQDILNIPGVVSTNRDSDVFQEILNIPGVASMSNNSDGDSSGNSSSANSEHEDDSTDGFAPVCNFSEDPSPENQPATVSWEERFLGSVDIAAVLIGVGAIIGNFLV